MSGSRIRCVCGTVYDPSASPACPQCGAIRKANAEAGGTSAAHRGAAAAGAGAEPDFTGDRAGVFNRNKTVVVVVGAVALVVLAAMGVRSIVGGNDKANLADSAAHESGDGASQSHGGAAPSHGAGSTPKGARSGAGQSTREPRTGIAAFEGKWTLQNSNMQPEQVIPGISMAGSILATVVKATFTGPGAHATLAIDEAGSYVFDADVSGDGLYTADLKPAKYQGTVSAQGDITMTPNGLGGPAKAKAMLMPVTTNMPHISAKVGDLQLVMTGDNNNGFLTVFWIRPGGSGQPDTSIVGTWTNSQVFVDSYMPYRATLELRDDGSYRIRFTRSERGMLVVTDDGGYQFKRAVAMGPPVQGRYTFDGPDRFTLTEPRGSATWVRAKD